MIPHLRRLRTNFHPNFLTKKVISRSNGIRKFSTVIEPTIPEGNRKLLAGWLLGVAGLVAGMVTVGGVTRLTRSGLSMTDWKLSGSLPPMSTAEWEVEFNRYKQFPEWKQRQSMTLDEFKYIYFWEYGHRMMGRVIGLAFAVPGLYFAARGIIPRHLYPRMALLFSLGGGQGLIGWWMVKSGLEMDPQQKKEIRVSPYRLATHLSMAFTTYVALLFTAFDLLNPKELRVETALKMTTECTKYMKKMRRFAIFNTALVATTVLSGAFVAGNDAGNAFNSFPKMGDEWIPREIYEDLSLTPLWRKLFEDTATVQFDHRVLALSTMTSILLMFTSMRRRARGAFWAALPRSSQILFHSMAGMVVVQVGLGISTLLMYVPIPLAAAHQAGSLVLLTFSTGLVHSLGFAKVRTTGLSSFKNLMRAPGHNLAKNVIAKNFKNLN